MLKLRPLLSAFSHSIAVLACAGAIVVQAQTLKERPAQPVTTPQTESQIPSNPHTALILPKGASLQVETVRHYPMKAGEAIDAELLHPIFADGRLVVPEKTLLRGKVTALDADTKMRWHGRLRGDFTPFHTAKVEFDELVLPGGPLAIVTDGAASGAPVVKLNAAGVAHKRGFIAQQWSQAMSQLHDRIADITAPGKGDRALQLLYHQLPYHPERIEAHTAWSFELAASVELPQGDPVVDQNPPPAAKPGSPETWQVRASLDAGLTSATAQPGDAVQATVVEPVFDKDHNLVVPQGSVLVGKVTTAKAARTLGRNGKLRFTFQQVKFPEGANRPVEGALAGATTESTRSLSMDAEGTVTPKNQSSVIAPLLLTMLAGRALDDDGNFTAQTGVASNGFGLIGRVVGVTAGSRNIAAGIGFYAAGLSFYENFLRPGNDVVFPRNTRIEIETTPLRAPVLKPDGD